MRNTDRDVLGELGFAVGLDGPGAGFQGPTPGAFVPHPAHEIEGGRCVHCGMRAGWAGIARRSNCRRGPAARRALTLDEAVERGHASPDLAALLRSLPEPPGAWPVEVWEAEEEAWWTDPRNPDRLAPKAQAG